MRKYLALTFFLIIPFAPLIAKWWHKRNGGVCSLDQDPKGNSREGLDMPRHTQLPNSKNALLIAPFRATLIITVIICGLFILAMILGAIFNEIPSPSKGQTLASTLYILVLILITFMSVGLVAAYGTALLFFWPLHKVLESIQQQTMQHYIMIGFISGLITLFSIPLISFLYQGSLSTGIYREKILLFYLSLFILPTSFIGAYQFHKIACTPYTKVKK